LIARNVVEQIVIRIFPVTRTQPQSMSHRPEILGRARRHVTNAEMLEHAERDASEKALRLRRPEEDQFIFIVLETERIDPSRRCLRHMIHSYLPAELVALGNEGFGPGTGDHIVGTLITHAA